MNILEGCCDLAIQTLSKVTVSPVISEIKRSLDNEAQRYILKGNYRKAFKMLCGEIRLIQAFMQDPVFSEFIVPQSSIVIYNSKILETIRKHKLYTERKFLNYVTKNHLDVINEQHANDIFRILLGEQI